MSWQATNWALEQKTGDVGRKVLLLLLANLADENHSCFPGQERLARESEQSLSTVKRQLKRLEEDGYIRREHRDGRGAGRGKGRTSDRYYLMMDAVIPRGQIDTREIPPPTGHLTVPTGHLTTSQVSPVTYEPLEEPLVVEPLDSSSPAQPATVADPFDEFWSHYPRKVGKGQARKAWVKALTLVPPDEIIAGAQALAADPNLPGLEFIPHPGTWLAREGWEDAPYPVRHDRASEEKAIYGPSAERARERMAAKDAQILADRAAAAAEVEIAPVMAMQPPIEADPEAVKAVVADIRKTLRGA